MVDGIPCAERVAFMNSGTEATMHAIKVARARSGKDRIAKFEGGYHGVHECAQVSSILATQMGPVEDPQSVPDTPGIPQAFVDQVLTLFPFEPPYMEKAGMRADFVGHPVVTEPQATEAEIAAFRAKYGLADVGEYTSKRILELFS